MRVARVRSHLPFAALGVGLWLALHEAGLHATLAGVILGLMAPTRPARQPELIDAGALADVSTLAAASEPRMLAATPCPWSSGWSTGCTRGPAS